MVAHRISVVQEISPWDALLLAVKRAAAWAAFYDVKLGEVENDDDLAPHGAAYHWVEAAERANEKLARWSKMAVDAGVQAIMVQQAQTDGAFIAQVLNTALASVALGDELEARMRTALRQALLAVGSSTSPGQGTQDGEVDNMLEGDIVD